MGPLEGEKHGNHARFPKPYPKPYEKRHAGYVARAPPTYRKFSAHAAANTTSGLAGTACQPISQVSSKAGKRLGLLDPHAAESLRRSLLQQGHLTNIVTPTKEPASPASDTSPPRSPTQQKVLSRFAKELERYCLTAGAHGKVALPMSTPTVSASLTTLNTVTELVPYHKQFKAAGLAVMSREQSPQAAKAKHNQSLAYGAGEGTFTPMDRVQIDGSTVTPTEEESSAQDSQAPVPPPKPAGGPPRTRAIRPAANREAKPTTRALLPWFHRKERPVPLRTHSNRPVSRDHIHPSQPRKAEAIVSSPVHIGIIDSYFNSPTPDTPKDNQPEAQTLSSPTPSPSSAASPPVDKPLPKQPSVPRRPIPPRSDRRYMEDTSQWPTSRILVHDKSPLPPPKDKANEAPPEPQYSPPVPPKDSSSYTPSTSPPITTEDTSTPPAPVQNEDRPSVSTIPGSLLHCSESEVTPAETTSSEESQPVPIENENMHSASVSNTSSTPAGGSLTELWPEPIEEDNPPVPAKKHMLHKQDGHQGHAQHHRGRSICNKWRRATGNQQRPVPTTIEEEPEPSPEKPKRRPSKPKEQDDGQAQHGATEEKAKASSLEALPELPFAMKPAVDTTSSFERALNGVIQKLDEMEDRRRYERRLDHEAAQRQTLLEKAKNLPPIPTESAAAKPKEDLKPSPEESQTGVSIDYYDRNIDDRDILLGLKMAICAACDEDLDAWIRSKTGLRLRRFLADLKAFECVPEERKIVAAKPLSRQIRRSRAEAQRLQAERERRRQSQAVRKMFKPCFGGDGQVSPEESVVGT